MSKQRIIVFDGHDAAGKTSISKQISSLLGYKYIKPFSDSLGDLVAWLIRCENYVLANKIALSAIEKAIKENPKTNLVFDRHWISMFTLIPDSLREEWGHKPFSILCWATPEKTIERLKKRNDGDISKWDHKYFCQKYLDISDKYNVPIIDTSFITIDEAVEKAMNIILNYWKDKD